MEEETTYTEEEIQETTSVEAIMIPHINAEKRHSRRFTCNDPDIPIGDIYFKRPYINEVKKVKVTVSIVE